MKDATEQHSSTLEPPATPQFMKQEGVLENMEKMQQHNHDHLLKNMMLGDGCSENNGNQSNTNANAKKEQQQQQAATGPAFSEPTTQSISSNESKQYQKPMPRTPKQNFLGAIRKGTPLKNKTQANKHHQAMMKPVPDSQSDSLTSFLTSEMLSQFAKAGGEGTPESTKSTRSIESWENEENEFM